MGNNVIAAALQGGIVETMIIASPEMVPDPPASTVLEEVAIVGNTATLQAITDESPAFVAYNDETFQFWVSTTETTSGLTLYGKEDAV